MLLSSCKTQELENYDENYRGKWKTNNYFSPTVGDSIKNYLEVNGKDSGLGIGCETDCQFCNCLIFQSGRAKINVTNKQLQVGGTVNQIMFITQEPVQDENGVWSLALDEVPYYRYD